MLIITNNYMKTTYEIIKAWAQFIIGLIVVYFVLRLFVLVVTSPGITINERILGVVLFGAVCLVLFSGPITRYLENVTSFSEEHNH